MEIVPQPRAISVRVMRFFCLRKSRIKTFESLNRLQIGGAARREDTGAQADDAQHHDDAYRAPDVD